MPRVYAQLAAASAPLIETRCAQRRRPTVRRYRGRIICTMLKCPPRKETLRACRSAGSLIVIGRPATVRDEPRSRRPVLGAPPSKDGSLWTVSVAPCSPCQGRTLTRLRAALA
jgi:hypothetical protein